MAFVKRDVKDRAVEHPRRYRLIQVEPGIFDLEPITGEVIEPGTPINKAYLQPIEEAIEDIEDGTTVVQNAYSANNAVISDRATKLATPRNINGVPFDGTQPITIVDNTKAPTNHASTGTGYGVGTAANYGHCKSINNLTRTSYVDGENLSAYQGKLLKELIDSKNPESIYIAGNIPMNAPETDIISFSAAKKYTHAYVRRSSSTQFYYSLEFDVNTGVVFYALNINGNISLDRSVLTSNSQDISAHNDQYMFRLYMRKVGNLITISLKGAASTDNGYAIDIF